MGWSDRTEWTVRDSLLSPRCGYDPAVTDWRLAYYYSLCGCVEDWELIRQQDVLQLDHSLTRDPLVMLCRRTRSVVFYVSVQTARFPLHRHVLCPGPVPTELTCRRYL